MDYCTLETDLITLFSQLDGIGQDPNAVNCRYSRAIRGFSRSSRDALTARRVKNSSNIETFLPFASLSIFVLSVRD
jgi:hypothetical protein